MHTDRKQKINAYIHSEEYLPLLLSELASVLDVPARDMEELTRILDDLQRSGEIVRTSKGRYKPAMDQAGLLTGIFSGNARKYGFVLQENGLKDIFIGKQDTFGAMHGDTVMVRARKTDNNQNPEGEIVKILHRAHVEMVCFIEKAGKCLYAVPDEKRIFYRFIMNKTKRVKPGQKAIVVIEKYPGAHARAGLVNIKEVLGWPGEGNTDFLAFISRFGLPGDFSQKVVDQAKEAASNQDFGKNRKQLFDCGIITIDGEDAKDLDDAVYVEKTAGGDYILSVHIADVSHFVTAASYLDKEAMRRGSSVYLVGGVVPMLPQVLSNGACSLHPGKNKAALSVDMHFNSEGELLHHQIYKSIIRTSCRMTYTQVNAILEGAPAEEGLTRMLFTMKELRDILKKKRSNMGSMDFDLADTRIKYGQNREIEEICRYTATTADSIIEEFMIACNKTVAEKFFTLDIPFVYRVHQKPDPEKIMDLALLLSVFGIRLEGKMDDLHPSVLMKVLGQAAGSAQERIISSLILRAMMKAIYSTNCIGHYGIGAKYYCHFTSPIRRYADLAVHRIISEYLDTGTVSDQSKLQSFADAAAFAATEGEKRAEEAERESLSIEIARHMEKYTGQVFESVICSVAGYGFYVELDNTARGLVRAMSLRDDYYIHIPSAFCLRAQGSGREYRIGDALRVVLLQADTITGELTFEVYSE